jgi:hypothetical protein
MSSLALTHPSAGVDTYHHTLRELRDRTEALSEVLDGAELRRGPVGRHAALSDLHTRLRAMDALTNHALGGWPDDDQEQP